MDGVPCLSFPSKFRTITADTGRQFRPKSAFCLAGRDHFAAVDSWIFPGDPNSKLYAEVRLTPDTVPPWRTETVVNTRDPRWEAVIIADISEAEVWARIVEVTVKNLPESGKRLAYVMLA